MILSEGKNKFDNNRFIRREWSAPCFETAEEVTKFFVENKIAGREVSNITAIGMGYNWNDYSICESVYCAIEKMRESGRIIDDAEEVFLPDYIKIPCCAEIDEPIIIRFADGDSLAILFDKYGKVSMALNTIPENIMYGTSHKNFHADKLFSDMLGKIIEAVEVTSSVGTSEFFFSDKEQDVYIEKIAFLYCNEDHLYPRRKLTFTSEDYDYCDVELIDNDGSVCTVSKEEILEIVKGYIDEEGNKSYEKM